MDYVITNSKGVDTTPDVFVRCQDHIAIDSQPATGVRITADYLKTIMTPVAFKAMILEIFDKGTAILPNSEQDIQDARLAAGLSVEDLAFKSGVSVELVVRAEQRSKRSDVHDLKKLCDVINLDVRILGFPKEWLK